MKLPLWKTCLYASLLSAALLAIFEGVLALAGVVPARLGHDPLVGFTANSPLFVPSGTNTAGDRLRATAPAKRRFFNEQTFIDPKPARTVRIFCPGESTTYGHPYHDPTSFSGWLRELLPAAAPATQWDVINAGGISYASYRLAAMMQELVRYQPDVFIVYVGHNEFLEARTYAELRAAPAWRRELTNLALHSRMAEVLLDLRDRVAPPAGQLAGEVSTILDQSIGPSAYHRDEAQQRAIVEHYRLNLRRIIALARNAGAEVILVLPASSLRDCTPFKSQPSDGLPDAQAREAHARRTAGVADLRTHAIADAVSNLTEAVRIDPHHAQGQYALAESLDAAGRSEEARSHYIKARDEDIVPVRAVSPILAAVREIAALEHVPLVDYPALLETDARARGRPDSLPGADQFLDHVHPTIDANRILAEALIDVLRRQGRAPATAVITPEIRAQVTRRIEGGLDRHEQGLALRNVAKVLSWAGKSDDAARTAGQALDFLGDDAECHFIMALAAQESGDWAEAEQGYRRAVELDPDYMKAIHNRGITLAHLDRLDEAVALYHHVIEVAPDHATVHYNLGRALYRLGEDDAALAAFDDCVRRDPRDADAHYYRAQLFRLKGDLPRARAAIQTVLTLVPGDTDALALADELAE